MTPNDESQYYEEDNKILNEFVEFFFPKPGIPRDRKSLDHKWRDEYPYEHKVFTIGGKKWTAVEKTGYEDKDVPTDRRIEAEVVFEQLDKSNPRVVITIQTKPGFA